MTNMISLDENYSTTKLVTKEKPATVNSPEDNFETVLFLPVGEGRKGEGGLRTKGYFKHSYKLVTSEQASINNNQFTDQSFWWITDSDNNLVKPAPAEIQQKINEYVSFISNSPSEKPSQLPLISIITVVYNGEKHLEETIQSVINQNYPNVEYIIIDGGSTDGTLDIIKKYEHVIDYWVSEPDKGIYDAMNKGIDVATGNWINFMNAGDKFANKFVLSKIKFGSLKNNILLYGKKIQNNGIINPLPIRMLEVGVIHANHQSMFFNKYLLKDALVYNVKYKIYGDYELVNRLYLKYPKQVKFIDIVVADFEGGGISSVASIQKRKEKYETVYKYYGFYGVMRALLHRAFVGGNN